MVCAVLNDSNLHFSYTMSSNLYLIECAQSSMVLFIRTFFDVCTNEVTRGVFGEGENILNEYSVFASLSEYWGTLQFSH